MTTDSLKFEDMILSHMVKKTLLPQSLLSGWRHMTGKHHLNEPSYRYAWDYKPIITFYFDHNDQVYVVVSPTTVKGPLYLNKPGEYTWKYSEDKTSIIIEQPNEPDMEVSLLFDFTMSAIVDADDVLNSLHEAISRYREENILAAVEVHSDPTEKECTKLSDLPPGKMKHWKDRYKE